ncbi:anthranilate phosphoribosyltransferase [Calidithermus roseus]|uniref:Anthranilate phosphoribosyltransferase n=1 Tax=Calidithermus roseus TaxID=1644118 RepID=A0A399EUD0_9DEIN|nr:anthranilate phosphoribosyltransferase [Calidithermus roseus]RIH87235.1 Anthranilate phosphoribosyltransferase [Calidithermus roseus]
MDPLKKVLSGEQLSQEEARALMGRIMAGELTPAQMAGVLVALRVRGETLEEITGFAEGMREAAVTIRVSRKPLVDIVGTGGIAPEAFNISTTSCFVVAAGGVAVAKHGNRLASSRSGSFDLLEALGIRLDTPVERVAEGIEALGIGFLFARNHHPAMRHVAPVRAELGVRTVFNILGPLTNPAYASHYVLGVYTPALLETFANAVRKLGAEAALVVHGDGLDDFGLWNNQLAELHNGSIRRYALTPGEVGLPAATYEQLTGGTPPENAVIARAILSGQERGPRRDAVALTAGAAFYISGRTPTIAQGVTLAQEVLDSGAGLELLERLVRFTQG